MNHPPISSPGARGPADHDIRDQIVAAANEHFSQYGYSKTTVSDLAKAIGFSKAYIYKFFDSKQAIGEAICSSCLAQIVAAVEQAISEEGDFFDRTLSSLGQDPYHYGLGPVFQRPQAL